MQQTTNTILMIRPVSFRMNEQTAVNNYYQKILENMLPDAINAKAQKEFDSYVEKLRGIGVNVIVVNDRPSLLEDWDKRLQAGDGIRGDQEALHDMINNAPHEQIQELPQEYQWLRISLNKGVDSPTKKIIHWTGPKGKAFIREHLQHGRKYTGQTV